ncbi:MAG TPA: type II toxin-antitoxin system VapC family toxin [Fibrobacteria bacterium]|nr:type II toxin-antitoxin system VapC family toxin [Fibrobacteria bacterium]
MRLLLDTHALIWALADPAKLARESRDRIEDPSNEIFVSAASLWEIAIKVDTGKLSVPDDLERGIFAVGFQPMEIRFPHVRRLRSLPLHHRDPFDRILVAQAMHEDLAICTRDRRISSYPVRVVEA